jgi:hypothetical protein
MCKWIKFIFLLSLVSCAADDDNILVEDFKDEDSINSLLIGEWGNFVSTTDSTFTSNQRINFSKNDTFYFGDMFSIPSTRRGFWRVEGERLIQNYYCKLDNKDSCIYEAIYGIIKVDSSQLKFYWISGDIEPQRKDTSLGLRIPQNQWRCCLR